MGLAILHTWPLATAPGTLSRNDNQDTCLNEWIVAWVAHQAVNEPARLFDANAFYPEPRALAFGELLLVPSAMAAPLLWLGASPVLAYNLLLLAGFALTGWTTSLVIERWTGDAAAGLLAGATASFNAHTLTRLPHVQAIHAEFLPLALAALDLLLVRRAVLDALRLAWWFVLQALSSGYLMVFTAVALSAGALARPREWLGHPGRRAAMLAGLAAIVATAALLPFLLPYYWARHEQGMVRPIEEAARYAASSADYLSTAGRIHYTLWSERFYNYGAASLFPGVTAVALAAVALGPGRAIANPRARMLVFAGAVGFVLSFGPAVPGFRTAYRLFPLLEGTRNVSRFGYLVLVAVAGLAGFGLAEIRARLVRHVGPTRGRRLSTWASVACMALVTAEALRAPMPYTRFDGISPVYDRLAGHADAVVAEFPFFEPHEVAFNGTYLLASTRHWKPLLNGYNGFVPASYRRHAEAVLTFPDSSSLSYLRRTGVTHIVVHADAAPGVADAVRGEPALVLVAEHGTTRLYRLEPDAP